MQTVLPGKSRAGNRRPNAWTDSSACLAENLCDPQRMESVMPHDLPFHETAQIRFLGNQKTMERDTVCLHPAVLAHPVTMFSSGTVLPAWDFNPPANHAS
jgi:hypothetical protein